MNSLELHNLRLALKRETCKEFTRLLGLKEKFTIVDPEAYENANEDERHNMLCDVCQIINVGGTAGEYNAYLLEISEDAIYVVEYSWLGNPIMKGWEDIYDTYSEIVVIEEMERILAESLVEPK